MAGFVFNSLSLDDALLIETIGSYDNRGGFIKSFEKTLFHEGGLSFSVDETFISVSSKNVIRGLHFQLNNPQAKLVSVLHGRIWDVIVDLRPKSKTFGKWISIDLGAENKALYVPKGFAHGFASLEDETIVHYQCEGRYDKQSDSGIIYNDPDLGIQWPIDDSISIHSERDMQLLSYREYLANPMNTI